MKIYIAGFYDTKERLIPHARKLEEMGHEVTSEWLKEDAANTYASVTEGYRYACAVEDVGDVKSSELMLLDTFDVSPRGGREFEAGVAFSHGIPVIVVGPYRNVFHRLFRRLEGWDEALDYMRATHRR